jgi:hypothetical protein
MNKYYSNILHFVTFSVRPKNKLAFLTYPTNNFKRIDAIKLSDKFENLNMDKVILVFVTNYRTTKNFTTINKNLALLTVSIEELLEDTTSFNLIFNISQNSNIVFLFKDIVWTHIVNKLNKLGYTLYTPNIELSPMSLRFTKLLNCIDELIGYSLFDIYNGVMDTRSDEELLKMYIEINPIDKDKDLFEEPFLIFDKEKSNIKYTDIDREVDDFLNS